MYLVKPELFDLEGFDDGCLWMLTRCFAKRASNDTKFSFPSYTKIASDTGYSERKVFDIVKKLVEIGLVKKVNRYRENGSQTSNGYYLDTDLVFVIRQLKSEMSDSEDNLGTTTDSQEQKNTTLDVAAPPLQNLQAPLAKNDTPLTTGSKLTTTTSIKDSENFFEKIPKPKPEIDIWEPNPVYQQAIDRVCPSLTPDDYTLELLAFRDHHRTKPPLNPDKAWTNWCKLAETNAYTRLKSKERVDRADDQANQRMQEFDALKRENIAKIGTNPTKNNYSGKPSNQNGFVPKPIFEPRPSDFRNRKEFDQACIEARHQGKIVEPYPITTTDQELWGENVAVSFSLNSRLATYKNVDQNVNQTDLHEAKRRALIQQFNSI